MIVMQPKLDPCADQPSEQRHPRPCSPALRRACRRAPASQLARIVVEQEQKEVRRGTTGVPDKATMGMTSQGDHGTAPAAGRSPAVTAHSRETSTQGTPPRNRAMARHCSAAPRGTVRLAKQRAAGRQWAPPPPARASPSVRSTRWQRSASHGYDFTGRPWHRARLALKERQ